MTSVWSIYTASVLWVMSYACQHSVQQDGLPPVQQMQLDVINATADECIVVASGAPTAVRVPAEAMVTLDIQRSGSGGMEGGGRLAVAIGSEGPEGWRVGGIFLQCDRDAPRVRLAWGTDPTAEWPERPNAVGENLRESSELVEYIKTKHAELRERPACALSTARELGPSSDGRVQTISGSPFMVSNGDQLIFVNHLGMSFIQMHAGRFDAGTHIPGHDRTVVLSAPYFMQTTEVTEAQMSRINGREMPEESVAQLPVVNVSWFEAVESCAMLSTVDGLVYGLPTEAQWEYACQGGVFAGFDPTVRPSDVMWNAQNASSRQAVATTKPNRWGLYDMHGNVREWCKDWWGKAPLSGLDPMGPKTGVQRVSRGGAWTDAEHQGTCGYRDARPPELATEYQGFRMVILLDGARGHSDLPNE